MKSALMLLWVLVSGISCPAQYAFTNFAGMPGGHGNANGTGSVARFYNPYGIASDQYGNVYVADTGNQTIRRITPGGATTTVAGRPGESGAQDGASDLARFRNPTGVAVDRLTNIYVADSGNHAIRKISPGGFTETLAGKIGQSGTNDGVGGVARFYLPWGLAVDDALNVYVADRGSHTIRKITPAGDVTTLAGSPKLAGATNGLGRAARFNEPYGVAVGQGGKVYVADTLNHTIREITPEGMVSTLAGLAGRNSDTDGAGSEARFNHPSGLTVDPDGNIAVADRANCLIRRVTLSGQVSTIAGNRNAVGNTDGIGGGASFNYPMGVASDASGHLYVADWNNCTIRKIQPPQQVTTLAGMPERNGSQEGVGTTARFFNPTHIAVDSTGNLFVADRNNHRIRKITPAGLVTTLAGGLTGSTDGLGNAARFNNPEGVATDSAGNVYVGDDDNHLIRKITPQGAVSTLAGSAGQGGSTDGVGQNARFRSPAGVAVDSATNVYVADMGNQTIRKITPEGLVTTLAGTPGQYGAADGTAGNARFNYPMAVAVDLAGIVYVADTYNYTIRKVTPSGFVSTLAGLAGTPGNTDGTGSSARFASPAALVIDRFGDLYVVDKQGHTIRRVTPQGVVTTIAGYAGIANGEDGVGRFARFSYPGGIAIDNSGNLYVVDSHNNRISKGTWRPAPAILSFSPTPWSRFWMLGKPGDTNVLESSADLLVWSPLNSFKLGADGVTELELASPPVTNAFFRTRAPGAPGQ